MLGLDLNLTKPWHENPFVSLVTWFVTQFNQLVMLQSDRNTQRMSLLVSFIILLN